MASVLDVLTLDEAKAAVNLPASRAGNEETLEQANTAVALLLDDLCGPIVVREVAGEVHPGGSWWVIPRVQPVDSITTVVEYNSTVPTTLAAEVFPGTTSSYDYWLDDIGILRRRSGGSDAIFGGTRVVLTYDAGRYATTEVVDAKFKRAAAEILQGNWSKYAAAWARGGDAIADPLFFDEVGHVLNRWLARERLAPGIA